MSLNDKKINGVNHRDVLNCTKPRRRLSTPTTTLDFLSKVNGFRDATGAASVVPTSSNSIMKRILDIRRNARLGTAQVGKIIRKYSPCVCLEVENGTYRCRIHEEERHRECCGIAVWSRKLPPSPRMCRFVRGRFRQQSFPTMKVYISPLF